MKVDYAIMETGLGGRLDSVSICNPIISVITSISLDHAEILGNTLSKITLCITHFLPLYVSYSSVEQVS